MQWLLFELHVVTVQLQVHAYLRYVSHEKVKLYTVVFKLQVVERAERTTNREASRKFKVDKKRVREWKLQRQRLKDTD